MNICKTLKSKVVPSYIVIAFLLSNAINASSWPTKSWDMADPKSLGMNADSLEAYSDQLRNGSHGYIDGMLITRNGKIVFEEKYSTNYDSLYKSTNTSPGKYNYYDSEWHPYYKDTDLHTMQSVSKSFTSTAIAIANKDGDIPDLNAEIMNYFQEFTSKNPNQLRNKISILDVLNMSSGIEWDESSMAYTDASSNCVQMEKSSDWIQYVIDQNMAHEPGTKFNYNSGETMLLSKLINKTTG